MKKVFVLAVVVLAMAVSAVYAQQETSVPPLINYQGRLTDAEGKGLTGTRKIEFNIYDAATGGNLIWGSQVFNSVPLINGMFNVILGSTNTAGRLITDAFNAKERYIGVTVDGKAILPEAAGAKCAVCCACGVCNKCDSGGKRDKCCECY